MDEPLPIFGIEPARDGLPAFHTDTEISAGSYNEYPCIFITRSFKVPAEIGAVGKSEHTCGIIGAVLVIAPDA